jgi:hypothetical protein
VARLNEVRLALASLVRESDRDNKTELESGKYLGMIEIRNRSYA